MGPQILFPLYYRAAWSAPVPLEEFELPETPALNLTLTPNILPF